MTDAPFNYSVHDAAERGDVDALVLAVGQWPHLIDAEQPSNLRRTPMHVAAANGHSPVVETLHRLGSTALDRPNKYGRMPIHLAAMYGHASVIETLHRLGSTSLDRPEFVNGSTPMHIAAEYGHAPAVETLHRLGSTALDVPNSISWTPMHGAVAFGDTSMVETLIRLGCTTLDRRGSALLRLAFARNRTAVAELLFAAGVDPANLADDHPQQVRELLATPTERLLELRHRLYFSSTLLDLLLGQLGRSSSTVRRHTDEELVRSNSSPVWQASLPIA